MAIITNINDIITVLQNDAALSSFCQTKWGKALTLKKCHLKPAEINSHDLPIIFITRLLVTKENYNSARGGTQFIRFYCGFRQPDSTKGLDEVIEFEERIDDALFNSSLGGIIRQRSAVYDEGTLHPVYFFMSDIEIEVVR